MFICARNGDITDSVALRKSAKPSSAGLASIPCNLWYSCELVRLSASFAQASMMPSRASCSSFLTSTFFSASPMFASRSRPQVI